MKTLTITFRAVKSGQFKDTIDAVFLDADTFENNYRLQCYTRIGQHSSGDIDYFYNNTRPAKPSEYESLLKELRYIYESDGTPEEPIKLIVVNRLPRYSSMINLFKEGA